MSDSSWTVSILTLASWWPRLRCAPTLARAARFRRHFGPTRGLRNTHYGVFLGVINALGATDETAIGRISVPQSATPVELEDLLGLPILPGYTATMVLTQAEYDAIAVKNP